MAEAIDADPAVIDWFDSVEMVDPQFGPFSAVDWERNMALQLVSEIESAGFKVVGGTYVWVPASHIHRSILRITMYGAPA